MKKKIIIAALGLTLSLGIGATAYAASTADSSASSTYAGCLGQGAGFGRITGQRGFEFMTNFLKNKFGIEETEINAARSSGKTMFDLAKDKGITAEQFKSAMVEEKVKAIDAAVEEGTISKEDGEKFKAAIKENSANCTTPGQMRGRNGGGRGMGLGRNYPQ